MEATQLSRPTPVDRDSPRLNDLFDALVLLAVVVDQSEDVSPRGESSRRLTEMAMDKIKLVIDTIDPELAMLQ